MKTEDAKHLTHYLYEHDPRCAECGAALIRGLNTDFCSEECQRDYDAVHPDRDAAEELEEEERAAETKRRIASLTEALYAKVENRLLPWWEERRVIARVLDNLDDFHGAQVREEPAAKVRAERVRALRRVIREEMAAMAQGFEEMRAFHAPSECWEDWNRASARRLRAAADALGLAPSVIASGFNRLIEAEARYMPPETRPSPPPAFDEWAFYASMVEPEEEPEPREPATDAEYEALRREQEG